MLRVETPFLCDENRQMEKVLPLPNLVLTTSLPIARVSTTNSRRLVVDSRVVRRFHWRHDGYVTSNLVDHAKTWTKYARTCKRYIPRSSSIATPEDLGEPESKRHAVRRDYTCALRVRFVRRRLGNEHDGLGLASRERLV